MMRASTDPMRVLRRSAIVLLILEVFLIFPPLIILGSAINWPASLDEPASVNLPLVLEQYGAVMAGYGIYLVYSLLFWPVAYLTGRVIAGDDTENLLFRLASGFGALSALARALGIVRWLFAMPILAQFYTAPTASSELKENISVTYEMLNAYAGGVGELLGVSLFAAIWLVLIGILIIQKANWPNWLGYFGFVAAISLFLNLLEVIGIAVGPMTTISVGLVQFWMLAAAIVFFRKKDTSWTSGESHG
ncbi:MAG: DUF4386 domain-containing protein [Caldilinea sp.]|jgi:hypothetical protein